MHLCIFFIDVYVYVVVVVVSAAADVVVVVVVDKYVFHLMLDNT